MEDMLWGFAGAGARDALFRGNTEKDHYTLKKQITNPRDVFVRYTDQVQASPSPYQYSEFSVNIQNGVEGASRVELLNLILTNVFTATVVTKEKDKEMKDAASGTTEKYTKDMIQREPQATGPIGPLNYVGVCIGNMSSVFYSTAPNGSAYQPTFMVPFIGGIPQGDVNGWESPYPGYTQAIVQGQLSQRLNITLVDESLQPLVYDTGSFYFFMTLRFYYD
jgi:hypothetical protein